MARVAERGVELRQRLEGPFEPAKDAAKMESAAKGAFGKLGDTRFSLQKWSWRNPAALFVPVSRLNEARRLLCEALEHRCQQAARGRVEAALADCGAAPRTPPAPEAPRWSIKVDRLDSLRDLGAEDWAALDELVVDVSREPLDGLDRRMRELSERAGRPVRVALPMVARGWESKALAAKVSRLREAGFSRWEAANVSAFSRLLGGQPELSTDWSVYVLNRLSALQVLEMGASRFALSPEDGLENMRELISEFGARAAVIAYQDTPLFVSESCPYASLKGGCPGPANCHYLQMELVSSHGGRVLAVNDRCRAWVVNAVPFCLADRIEVLLQAGARHLRADFVYRHYEPAQVAAIFRRLRTGEPVAGHRGNFQRGLGRDQAD